MKWLVLCVAVTLIVGQASAASLIIKNGRKTWEQAVSRSGESFTIEVAGNTDPVMRRLEIIGPVVDPKVVCDRWVDPETPATVLKSILKPGMSDREKAMAIFWYCQENFSRNTPWIWDDARFACALGFGHCGPTGFAQSALCNAAGLQWHQMRLWGHNCIQVWYDDRWHVLDAYMRAIYPGPTGDYAASATELAKQPELITRNCGEDGREMKELIDINFIKKIYSSYDGGVQFELGKKWPWDGNRIAYALRAGERIIFWWDRRLHCSYPELPGNFTNPELLYEPDLRGAEAKDGVSSSQNVRWGDGGLPLHVAEAGKPAEVVWEVSSYYNLMAGWIEGEFARAGDGDLLRVSVSADGGKTWKAAWEHAGTGLVKAQIDLADKLPFKPECYSKGLRGYLVRVEMNAKDSPARVGIASIRFRTELLAHNRALPALLKGKNTLTVTATSMPRPFKVIYEYDEAISLAADRYDPVEGTTVKLVATVANSGDAPAANVRVQFYDGDPGGLGKPIGQPVVIPAIAAGQSATAELAWPCEATGDRGPFYHGTPQKPFYYCMSSIYALVNHDGKPLAKEVTADFARLHLFIRQRPKLLISEPFIVFIEDEKEPAKVRIRATVRNSCQWERWIYTRGTTVRNVVVRFFGGDPDKGGKQIGADQVIASLGPVGFAPADVVWDTSAVPPGKHTVHVVIDPDRRIAERDMAISNRAAKAYEVKGRR
ncbi:MAG: hypothetical protein FJ290_21505 [Planctomycetes bacterium]|nr:hypothetical protein [Planctomycetota bacterium]